MRRVRGICVSYLNVCTKRMLIPCSTFIVPFNKQGANQKQGRICNQGLVGVAVLTEAKAGCFIKQYQDLLHFQKVKFMDIFEISTICFMFVIKKKVAQQTRISFVLLLTLPCINAIEYSHKQKGTYYMAR